MVNSSQTLKAARTATKKRFWVKHPTASRMIPFFLLLASVNHFSNPGGNVNLLHSVSRTHINAGHILTDDIPKLPSKISNLKISFSDEASANRPSPDAIDKVVIANSDSVNLPEESVVIKAAVRAGP